MRSLGAATAYGALLTSAGLPFGISFGLFNTFFPVFIRNFPAVPPARHAACLANLNLAFVLGALACCLSGGVLMERWGRRRSLLVVLALEVVALCVQALPSLAVATAMRVPIGYACCFWTFLVPVLVRETFPFRLANWIAPLFGIFYAVGMLLGFFCCFEWMQRWAWMVLAWPVLLELPKLILFATVLDMESPVWLAACQAPVTQLSANFGKLYDAAEAGRLARELADCREKRKTRRAESLSDLLTDGNATRLFVPVLLNLLSRLSGINFFTFYSRLLFEELQLARPIQLTMAIGVANLLATLALPFLAVAFGRKTVMSGGLFGLSAAYCLVLGGRWLDSSLAKSAGFFLYMMSYAISLGGLLPIYCADLLPPVVLAGCATFQWALIAFFARYSLDIFRRFEIHHVFLVCQLATTLGGLLFVALGIETRGKTDEAIAEEFRRKGFFTH